jgi:hypothetical protein
MDTTMKSFKDYLQENKQVYEYKVKIAGECPKDCAKTMKMALEKFGCESVSAGKRTPIQESPLDFPNQKFSEVNMFDIKVKYPTTSVALAAYIAEQLKIANDRIRVLTPYDLREREINDSTFQNPKGEALLGKEYDTDSSVQGTVGQKHVDSFLKGLSKTKHNGTQVKGYNDQLLADKLPTGK